MAQIRVGVIGWPVEHSLSPVMHNAAFRALGMVDWHYDRVPIPPDIVQAGLKTLKYEGGYVGVNVTVPLKQLVMPHVRPDDVARAVGAVNTIDFRGDKATNTDVAGFVEDLAAHGIEVAGASVIVLGAGGAARAAVYGLARAGANVTVVNRTAERARQLVGELGVPAAVHSLDEAAANGAALVVNCTPVGMWPDEAACPWPDEVAFPEGATVYDMIYRPARTKLMQKAEAHGGRALNGAGMLVRQGAAAFEMWTGVRPPLDVMYAALRTALEDRV